MSDTRSIDFILERIEKLRQDFEDYESDANPAPDHDRIYFMLKRFLEDIDE